MNAKVGNLLFGNIQIKKRLYKKFTMQSFYFHTVLKVNSFKAKNGKFIIFYNVNILKINEITRKGKFLKKEEAGFFRQPPLFAYCIIYLLVLVYF